MRLISLTNALDDVGMCLPTSLMGRGIDPCRKRLETWARAKARVKDFPFLPRPPAREDFCHPPLLSERKAPLEELVSRESE